MSIFQNTPYKHDHILKFIVAFGNLFTGVTISKTDATGTKKQVYECPIEYAPKNKWISMLRERSDLNAHQVKMTLPRMAFEMVDIQYAPDRKIGVNGSYAVGEINGMRGKIFPPTPYDCIFELYVLTKDQNDSLQIVEQILPYFQPYMTMNYEILPEYKIFKDVPVTFQAYRTEDTYAGSPEEQRTVTTIFTFAAQMDFFGPMTATTAVIKDAIVKMGENYGKPTNITLEAKVDPITASISDSHTINTTITERV